MPKMSVEGIDYGEQSHCETNCIANTRACAHAASRLTEERAITDKCWKSSEQKGKI